MPSQPSLDRRTLLAGAAAGTVIAGSIAHAQAPARADMKGKAILITGCSSGFGRSSAEHFARAGAKVFATMRTCRGPRPRSCASWRGTKSST